MVRETFFNGQTRFNIIYIMHITGFVFVGAIPAEFVMLNAESVASQTHQSSLPLNW